VPITARVRQVEQLAEGDTVTLRLDVQVQDPAQATNASRCRSLRRHR
jgi:hypothetical protein